MSLYLLGLRQTGSKVLSVLEYYIQNWSPDIPWTVADHRRGAEVVKWVFPGLMMWCLKSLVAIFFPEAYEKRCGTQLYATAFGY
jgi:hypothetical protein